jgi:uncharacterized membrane protein YhaH (DUF805 family)
MGYFSIMTVTQVFFSFRGRIDRRTWWLYGVLAMLGLALLGHALLGIAGVAPERAQVVVNGLLLWPTLATSAKRWHDRDKPAWWLLLNLLPVLGWLWAIVENGLLAGSSGVNRFGEPLTDIY